ncbi:MAG: hypothetical protein WBA93_15365 [Microcoleaceae cyanobacterium]
MLANLKPLPIKDYKYDYKKDIATATIVAISQSQNAFYQWEKNPVLLAVGWLNIN